MLVAVLVAFGVPLAAWSQEAQATHPIALAEAVRQAREAAPEVMISVARSASVQAEVGVAGVLPNPKITIGTTTDSAALYGSLYIALPLFGQRGAAIDAAQAQARVAALGVDAVQLDAQLAVTLAWTDLWLIEQEVRIATDNAARRERLRDAARERFAEGGAPRLDLLRAETEARRVRAEVAALAEQRLAAAARLAGFLRSGVSPSSADLATESAEASMIPGLSDFDALLDAHPVVRRALALRQAGDSLVYRERRARWPLLGIQIGASFFERHPPPSQDISVAATLELPLFNRPLITRAETTRTAAQTELAAVRTQLRARLMSARSEYLAAHYRYRAQADEVLPAAREAAELSAEAYRSGKLDLTGALAAEQTLADTRLAVARAAAERSRALGMLNHAAGRSP